jgi:predicted RNA binding protein YcfA (HicA-like mRNA interferase family)
MGQRSYPPLKHREVVAIVIALGFALDREGSTHAQYERVASSIRPRTLCTVDNYDDFEQKMIKRIISQIGCSREEFYGATPQTAKKIR